MAIAPPASSQAGSQPESQNQPEVQPEIPNAVAGVEPETALPVAVPAESAGSAVSAPEAKDSKDSSSASHLSGYAPEDVKIIDDKFQKLLDTVHENRPGDDLEIIRKAWAFCLQQHEGQKRA